MLHLYVICTPCDKNLLLFAIVAELDLGNFAHTALHFCHIDNILSVTKSPKSYYSSFRSGIKRMTTLCEDKSINIYVTGNYIIPTQMNSTFLLQSVAPVLSMFLLWSAKV